jgi:hypothetical protein
MKTYRGIPLSVCRDYVKTRRWGIDVDDACTHGWCCGECCHTCREIRDQLDGCDRDVPPLAILNPYIYARKKRRERSRDNANRRREERRFYRSSFK